MSDDPPPIGLHYEGPQQQPAQHPTGERAPMDHDRVTPAPIPPPSDDWKYRSPDRDIVGHRQAALESESNQAEEGDTDEYVSVAPAQLKTPTGPRWTYSSDTKHIWDENDENAPDIAENPGDRVRRLAREAIANPAPSLAAENRRLREALEGLNNMIPGTKPCWCDPGLHGEDHTEACLAARAALQPQPEAALGDPT